MTRSSDLRVLAVTILEETDAVQDRLGSDGSVLVVDQILGDDPDNSDPRLFVDAEAVESNRNNKQEDKRFSVYVGADATPRFVRGRGDNALSKLLDAAVDALTEHPGDGWTVDGVVDEQNDGYIDDINRFRRIAQVAIERDDMHPAQTDN